MNITIRLLLATCLVLSFAACKKEDAAVKVEVAPLTRPATDDVEAWQPYVEDVVKRNMDGVNANPYVYFLPAESAADFQGQYDRLLEQVQEVVGRGIVEGNMLAFASPASARMADMVVAGFADVDESSLKGVKILFLGDAADSARVEAAVAPSGANYKFIEAK